MDREKESPPERLPFCLDDTVGEIVRASQECPGVYYIAARKQDGKFLADEYYVVEKSSPAISKEAMVYGRMPEEDSRVLLYSFAEERDIKSLSMRSIGIRSGTEYMQTDRPRFVILLFTIWSIIRNTLELIQRPLPRRGAVPHATSR